MKKIVFAVLVGVVVLPFVTSAAFMEAGEEVILRGDQVIAEDVYIAGGSIASSAQVDADLIAAGGSLFISNAVSADLIVAGGNVNIIGDVGDDVSSSWRKYNYFRKYN